MFLAGNHDNYLFYKYATTAFDVKADTSNMPEYSGLLIEHGLPSDSFNNHPTFPCGWLLTQAAFVSPSVRAIEETLGRLASSEGSRLQRIRGAVAQCIKHKCGIYVMGHTHVPFLTEVQTQTTFKNICEETSIMQDMEEDYDRAWNDFYRYLMSGGYSY